MNKPPIVHLPHCDGVLSRPGEALTRFHDWGQYCWPLGEITPRPTGFCCPHCRAPVRSVTLKRKQTTAFSCHCLMALCGSLSPKVDLRLWHLWITAHLQDQEAQKFKYN